MNWRGQPPGSGVPKHPTRKILDDPAVYEFATPVGGTFPPSFDPSYWDDTRSWTFSLRAQLLALKRHFRLYAGLFLRDQPGALTAALTLLLLGGAATRSAIARNWPLIAMCVTPLGLYALVYSEPRYVAGYVVLFWAVIFAGVRLHGSQQILAQYLVLAAVVTVILSVADGTVRSIEARGPYSAREHVDVADGLERIGITSGDRVAVLGDGNWSYWAELDKVKIITSTEEGEAAVFWSEPRVQRERVYRAFASTGAKAVVGVGPLKNDAEEGWRRIGNTNHYVKILTP